MRQVKGRSRWVLPAVLVLAAAVYVWGLGTGATHYYYSAAVRSMSTDWSNFFFGALDPAGSLTLDKLPGAFWVQALLVRLLGFHPWVLLLPGVLAAIATVGILFATVRRWAGTRAGVFAALALAATPVTFVVSRVNIPDGVLVFLLVSAAYALTRAMTDGRRWLLLAAVLVAFAFQVKMLQAWLLLPVFAVAYLLGAAAVPMRWRVLHTALFAIVAIGLSLCWLLLVSQFPDRPYVDGSTRNSLWQQVFSYNGISRAGAADGAAGSMSVPFGGAPGPSRLLNEQLGGQIGWLLPLAMVGALLTGRGRGMRAGWVLWAGWAVVCVLAFSAARGVHPYYTVLLAPALAALAGSGLHSLLLSRNRLALAGTIAASTACAVLLAGRAPVQPDWLGPVIVLAALGALGAIWLSASRLGALLLAVALLAGPAAWIARTPAVPERSMHTANPVAGPQRPEIVFGSRAPGPALSMMLGTTPGAAVPPVGAPLPGTTVDIALLGYLRENRDGERYLFATGEASSAAAYIAAGYSVLPMGGFTASSPFPSAGALAGLVRRGELRFVLLIPMPGMPGPSGARAGWVAAHCAKVRPAGYAMLYDCAQPG